MTKRTFGAVLGAALLVSVAGIHQAGAAQCTGPFKQCAIEVGAFCEIENGKLMIWYKDREGASSRFEQCVGKVYEKNGRQNPYLPASSQKAAPKR
jgi:hypothetical protein